jgi:hypothetical protein
MDGGREPPGLPGPGQQSFELAGPGPTRDHALEHVGEPSLWLDSTLFSFAVATRLATIA